MDAAQHQRHRFASDRKRRRDLKPVAAHAAARSTPIAFIALTALCRART
jgi:hypothetical protein